jgi:hypothetical protein
MSMKIKIEYDDSRFAFTIDDPNAPDARDIAVQVQRLIEDYLSRERYKLIQDAQDNSEVTPHVYKESYSGMSCGAMVMRAGGGDQCGLPYTHPLHILDEAAS